MSLRPAIVRMGPVRTDPESGWRENAECLEHDPELFFPVGRGMSVEAQERDAKAVCRQCPVTSECLQWALRAEESMAGVWGATTEEERKAFIRNRNRRSN